MAGLEWAATRRFQEMERYYRRRRAMREMLQGRDGQGV